MQIPTAPQLSSRMKHIKQEMAKNHLQFVRFEATDLHGVSRSKSIPAHFFQVSFLCFGFVLMAAPVLYGGFRSRD